LLFLPTTVGAMTWGVSFLQEGWHVDYTQAADRAATVAMGWVFGWPILGTSRIVSDAANRVFAGTPLMLAAMLAIAYLPPETFPSLPARVSARLRIGAAMLRVPKKSRR
jgi:hypothetical protein